MKNDEWDTLTGFRFLVHQGDRHHHVIRDGEAHLEIGAEGKLHTQKDIGKDGHELGIRPSLRSVDQSHA